MLLTETVFLLALVFLILAGEVFRIQNIYGKASQQNAQQIERLEPEVEALKFGTDDAGLISRLENSEIPIRTAPTDDEDEAGRMLSVRELDGELGAVTRLRGRVWRDVETRDFDPPSLTITLGIPAPNPHGIETDSILYAFEQGEAGPAEARGRQFIGEFRVTNAAPEQIQLQPAGRFDERSVGRLQQTQAPWILYENMPIDQHPDGRLQIFAGATPEQLQQMLPAASAQEYARHGGPTEPGDDEFHKSGYDESGSLVLPGNWDASTQFKYRRELRDYNLIFQELSKRYTQMQADYNALVEDNGQLQKALASAQKVQQMQQQEQAKLNQDLAGVTRDRQAIEAHKSQVETQLSNARALLDDVVQENAALGNSL